MVIDHSKFSSIRRSEPLAERNDSFSAGLVAGAADSASEQELQGKQKGECF
ncbi:hypothetical protein ACW9HR_12640 [Nocardia gipuzkoensis]